PNLPEIFFAAHGVSYVSVFGTPLGPDYSVYTDIENIHDDQLAGYGQVDYQILRKLTLTAGARVARFQYDFSSQNFGPFAGSSVGGGSHSEKSVAPKYGVSYQISRDDMIYATASRGFRPGGAERVPPRPCDSDLQSLGIGQAPSTYDSDNLWSYELGTKDTFAQRVSIAASAFYIKWNNIQQSIRLPVCGQSTILNLGSATSKGFDLSMQALLARG